MYNKKLVVPQKGEQANLDLLLKLLRDIINGLSLDLNKRSTLNRLKWIDNVQFVKI